MNDGNRVDRAGADLMRQPDAAGSRLMQPQTNDQAVDALVRALERRDTVSAHEREILAAAVGEVRVHPPGNTLIRAHRPTESSTLLIDGMLCREFGLADGKRQIVAVHVAGDFVDLHSLLLKSLDHDVTALTECRVVLFPHAALRRITETEPHLARMLWLLTVIDAAVHREWTARLGHSAAVRVAHLLCELQLRLSIVGLAKERGFAWNLTQLDLGDMVGLTAVHVNRTLRKLREAGLAIVRDGFAAIPDLQKLREFAGFDPTYLYTEPTPR